MQYLKNRKNVDFGHMVIKLGKSEMNPVWLLYIFSLKVVDERERKDGLLGLYKIWEDDIV